MAAARLPCPPPDPALHEFSPGGAPPVVRGAVRTDLCVCARARVAVVRERWREGGERAGSLALLGPSEDPCGRRLTADVGPPPALALSSRPLPLSPHPHRGVPRVSLFPDRLFRSVSLGGGARPSPVGGKGSAPRRHPAVAPGRACRAEPASCEACLVAAAVPPSAFPPPTPVRVPSYRVPARRFKDPGGVASPSPGSGGRRGP